MKILKKNVIILGSFVVVLLMVSGATAVPQSNGQTQSTVGSQQTNEILDQGSFNIGAIYGTTWYLLGWGMYPLGGVHIEIKYGDTVIRRVSRLLSCRYRAISLPLNREYTVTASSNIILRQGNQYYRLMPETVTVNLTLDKPFAHLDFALDTEPTNHNSNKEKSC